MPFYSLNFKHPEKEVEGDDPQHAPGRRRFSISTPQELDPRTMLPVPSRSSFSGDVRDPSEIYSPRMAHQSTRLERLITMRRMRKSGSCAQLIDPETLEANGIFHLEAENPSGTSSPQAPVVPRKQRLIVVANRLQVSAVPTADGGFIWKPSSGGLASALLGVKNTHDTCSIGWPGLFFEEGKRKKVSVELRKHDCVPVFLDADTVDQYYNGFCNNVLWPLLHYIGLPQEDRLATTQSIQSQFTYYQKANEMFADVVLQNYEEGDVVWVHDYHLMLLPMYLKQRNPRMKVGWFLHTPFPSSEIYRTLPWRAELLRSILYADLVGFHTYDYARHFVSACTRILGLEGTPEGVEDHGRQTRVAAFPIGIDPQRFIDGLNSEAVKSHVAMLRARFADRKVLLGVDRLDMIKGIPQKLLAFEKLLEDEPKWRDKVLLVQIAVPSRTDVPEYQRLTSQVHEIVGRINGKYGSFTSVPLHHLDRNLEFHELLALYAVTDVCLVTSLRDGMNLVSYEFVACQNNKKGVLILSEFAGAAQSLGAGAILVNPWNVSDVAASMAEALEMEEKERTERHEHNFLHVTTHTSQTWADTFISELNDTEVEAEIRGMRIPPQLSTPTVVQAYNDADNRLLILGFNSTLTQHVEAPRRGTPDQIKEMKPVLHPLMPEILRTLTSDCGTTVVIMSGSERAMLDRVFAGFDVYLAAENGMFMRPPKGEWMTTLPEHLHMEWVESVLLVFEYFCERTPRSYVEARETSLVWNYKFADVEFGRVQARDLLQHLWTGPISNAAVEVVQGSKSVEVRPVGVSKGASIERIVGEIAHQQAPSSPIDFVFCCGHFLPKDEDIFRFFEPDFTLEPEEPARRVSGEGSRRDRSKNADRSLGGKLKKMFGGGDQQQLHRKSSAGLSPDVNNARLEVGSVGRTSSRDKPTFGSGRNSGDSDDFVPGRLSSEYLSILDLNGDHYFSCTVGRRSSIARYSLNSSEELVFTLKALAEREGPAYTRNVTR